MEYFAGVGRVSAAMRQAATSICNALGFCEVLVVVLRLGCLVWSWTKTITGLSISAQLQDFCLGGPNCLCSKASIDRYVNSAPGYACNVFGVQNLERFM